MIQEQVSPKNNYEEDFRNSKVFKENDPRYFIFKQSFTFLNYIVCKYFGFCLFNKRLRRLNKILIKIHQLISIEYIQQLLNNNKKFHSNSADQIENNKNSKSFIDVIKFNHK